MFVVAGGTGSAMMLAWAGQLEPAHDEMRHIRRHCLQHSMNFPQRRVGTARCGGTW